MKEIQVPGSAPARNDVVFIYSRELDEHEALKRLYEKYADNEEEILDFVRGDGRQTIRTAAKIALQKLKEKNEQGNS